MDCDPLGSFANWVEHNRSLGNRDGYLRLNALIKVDELDSDRSLEQVLQNLAIGFRDLLDRGFVVWAFYSGYKLKPFPAIKMTDRSKATSRWVWGEFATLIAASRRGVLRLVGGWVRYSRVAAGWDIIHTDLSASSSISNSHR